MRIVATSDIHGTLPEIPHCDVLIVAGDVCPAFDHSMAFQRSWLGTNFRNWLEQVPAQQIIGIAGNHDFVFERDPAYVKALGLPWTYLQDSGYTRVQPHQGGSTTVKFWGLPWVPNLSRWAFHDNDYSLDRHFAAIPRDTDVVISHGPPHGYRDLTCPRFGSVHAGFPGANDMLERVKPKAFVCGHIHEGYGIEDHPSSAVIYNVSHNTEDYKPTNPPLFVDI